MKSLGAKTSKSLSQNLVEMPQREAPHSISSVDSQEIRT